jgi:hypothetical protein
MTIDWSPDGRLAVLRLSAERCTEASLEELERTLDELVERGGRALILDLGRRTLSVFACIEMIWAVSSRLPSTMRVGFCNLTPQAMGLLRSLETPRPLSAFASEAEARSVFEAWMAEGAGAGAG